MSKGCLAILLGIAIFIAVTLILAAVSVITWLDMLYYFSYVKLGITIIKWVKRSSSIKMIIICMVAGMFRKLT